MDKASVRRNLVKFRKALEAEGIREPRLILFGSHAHGRPRRDSDIDVVAISHDFNGRDLWERIEILSEAILKSHPLIEAVALTPKEWDNEESIFVEFARDGIEIAA